MQVSLETLSGLERKLTISVPASSVDQEINKRLSGLSKTARVNGFRAGKVPAQVIKQRYGADVRNEVLGDQMRKGFIEAVTQEKLNPAGSPTFDLIENHEGKDIKFSATFEVYPEVALADLGSTSVEKPVASIQDSDIENMLSILRKQQVIWEDKSDDAELVDGDKATINFEGFLEGEAFEGGKAEGHELVLGSNSMIPGFEEKILGMKNGEERRIQVTFPEDYHAENLKGKVTEFDIKVTKSQKAIEPELDQAFFEKYGVEATDLEGFKADVRQNMERELRQAIKALIKNQALEALLEANKELMVPSALVDQEIHELQHQFAHQYGQGSKVDPHSLPKELFKDRAERRVKLGLLINALVEQHSIQVDEAKVDEIIQDIASTYQDPEQVVEFYKSNKEQRAKLDALAIEEQAVETILGLAQVAENETTYDEVVRQAHQARG